MLWLCVFNTQVTDLHVDVANLQVDQRKLLLERLRQT